MQYGPRKRKTEQYDHRAYTAASHRAKVRLAKEYPHRYALLLKEELVKGGVPPAGT